MATTTVAKLRQSLVEGREAWGPEVACDQHEDEEVAPYSSQARYFLSYKCQTVDTVLQDHNTSVFQKGHKLD